MANNDASDTLAEARARLAARQESLLAALLLGAASPAGLDPAEIEAAGHSLRRKRRRELRQSWPELTSDFDAMFAEFLRECPTPPAGGPVVDGLLFARFLAGSGQLPASTMRHWLAFELRYVLNSTGQRRRRFVPLLFHRLSNSNRRLVAAWVPWFGPRWFWIPTAFPPWRAGR